MRSSAVLVGMHHVWPAHQHADGRRNDAHAVDDLDALAR